MGKAFHLVVGAIVLAIALAGFGLLDKGSAQGKKEDKNQGATTLTLGL
jgi:hypothetical protein